MLLNVLSKLVDDAILKRGLMSSFKITEKRFITHKLFTTQEEFLEIFQLRKAFTRNSLNKRKFLFFKKSLLFF